MLSVWLHEGQGSLITCKFCVIRSVCQDLLSQWLLLDMKLCLVEQGFKGLCHMKGDSFMASAELLGYRHRLMQQPSRHCDWLHHMVCSLIFGYQMFWRRGSTKAEMCPDKLDRDIPSSWKRKSGNVINFSDIPVAFSLWIKFWKALQKDWYWWVIVSHCPGTSLTV